jgi:superfamily II DNA or RNA helicase
MDRWPHQLSAVRDVIFRIQQGGRRIVLTSPTGGGKSLILEDLLRWAHGQGWPAVVYTNRRLLLNQLFENLSKSGLPIGVRAAGHPDRRGLPIQISSLQTEVSRVLKREERDDWRAWGLHRAKIVFVDEGHLFTRGAAQDIIRRHVDAGAVVIYVTATPLGMGDVADYLLVAGTTSELRKCVALVPARHFAPDEPYTRGSPKVPEGDDPTEKQQDEMIMRTGVFGRVYDHWKRLNPMGDPTILFGPSVGGSLYFAREFWRKGVPAAHLDSKTAWVNGKHYEVDDAVRADVMESSRDGRVAVVCNRFVLREGVDAPWLQHGIFACVFGNVGSYLQAGGRMLRRDRDSPRDHVTIQDHGGNFWRHGSLNADREWHLEYTAPIVSALRADFLRQRPDLQPRTCPECFGVFLGQACPCGFRTERLTTPRLVVQSDGELTEVEELPFKKRVVRRYDDTPAAWRSIYYRCLKSCTRGKNPKPVTFRQAVGLFVREKFYYPPEDLPLMPRMAIDTFRRVDEVPKERLY